MAENMLPREKSVRNCHGRSGFSSLDIYISPLQSGHPKPTKRKKNRERKLAPWWYWCLNFFFLCFTSETTPRFPYSRVAMLPCKKEVKERVLLSSYELPQSHHNALLSRALSSQLTIFSSSPSPSLSKLVFSLALLHHDLAV